MMTDYEISGIAFLRKHVPELYNMQDWLVRVLYRSYSEDVYCAGWMKLDTEHDAAGFRDWLNRQGELPG